MRCVVSALSLHILHVLSVAELIIFIVAFVQSLSWAANISLSLSNFSVSFWIHSIEPSLSITSLPSSFLMKFALLLFSNFSSRFLWTWLLYYIHLLLGLWCLYQFSEWSFLLILNVQNGWIYEQSILWFVAAMILTQLNIFRFT